MDTWPLCSTGLLFDRAWALVDAHGRAVTQKTFPQLALVQPVINLSDRTMLIRAPGMSEVLAIPLDREGGGASESESDGIQRCKDGEHVVGIIF